MAYGRLLERAGRLKGDLNRVQIRLLQYLSGADENSRGERRETFLRDLLLIVNPVLYNDVYDEHGNPKVSKQPTDQYRVPETEADMQKMMRELQSLGVS